VNFSRLCDFFKVMQAQGHVRKEWESGHSDLPLVRSRLWLVLPTGPASSFRFFPTLCWSQPKSIESAGQYQKYFHARFLPIGVVEKGNSPYSSEVRSNKEVSRGRGKDVENIAKGVHSWLKRKISGALRN